MLGNWIFNLLSPVKGTFFVVSSLRMRVMEIKSCLKSLFLCLFFVFEFFMFGVLKGVSSDLVGLICGRFGAASTRRPGGRTGMLFAGGKALFWQTEPRGCSLHGCTEGHCRSVCQLLPSPPLPLPQDPQLCCLVPDPALTPELVRLSWSLLQLQGAFGAEASLAPVGL